MWEWYTNTRLSTKLLIWVCIIWLTIKVLTVDWPKGKGKEGFANNDTAPLFAEEHDRTRTTLSDIYDAFYASIYDDLFHLPIKDRFEVSQCVELTDMAELSKIGPDLEPDTNAINNTNHVIMLDIGCGTGHHIKAFSDLSCNCLGIDQSESMIRQAQKRYPKLSDRFKVLDVMEASFSANRFTHITCFYFTIYYVQNKLTFFRRCRRWLKPDGYLIVHLVDKQMFDPILPPGNPLLLVSPQKYAKERITQTQVTFKDFDYSSEFLVAATNDATNNNVQTNAVNTCTFDETMVDKQGYHRHHLHQLYMEPIDDLVEMAEQSGLALVQTVDMVKCQYEYQYLYIFQVV